MIEVLDSGFHITIQDSVDMDSQSMGCHHLDIWILFQHVMQIR